MERLTESHYNASDGYYIRCSERCDKDICDCECENFSNIVDRLGQIEDIFGDTYNLARLRELVEADKEGRVKIYPKSENSTCGACGHFHRIAGTRRGTCDVKPFATTRRGASWGYEFMASQSRKACKMYKPATESALAKEDNHE